jgi:hypothetical protein
MREGKKQKVNWNQYKSPNFMPPTKELPHEDVNGSCGTYALHILTGIPLKVLAREFKRPNQCWTDRRMLRFLRLLGFTVIPITLGTTCEVPLGRKVKLSNMHVILCSQHYCETEGTWTVIFRNQEFHSGEVVNWTAVDQFNCPVDTAYMVWHPKWAGCCELDMDVSKTFDAYLTAILKSHYDPIKMLEALTVQIALIHERRKKTKEKIRRFRKTRKGAKLLGPSPKKRKLINPSKRVR